MTKEIIINSSTTQTRVAITENGNLVDFFVDYPEKRRMVGDIYLGKVARVLPGIKAAFIDIGMKHDGFLHFSDIADRTKQFLEMLGEDTEIDVEENGNFNANNKHHDTSKNQNGTYTVKLHKGEDIIVQITKEPVMNKGVRVTSAVSLPGRFCVLLPFDNKIGVSKKIYDYREKRRLRYLAREIIPENYGLIIRTVAKNQDEAALKSDLNKFNQIISDFVTKGSKLLQTEVPTFMRRSSIPLKEKVVTPPPIYGKSPVESIKNDSDNVIDNDIEIGICAKKIYSFLYNNPEREFTKSQVGAVTGYSQKSGGFNNAL
ncbi:MAG: ribonuclease E/G, partial [Bacteroidetes bacterium]|nr:ribonuclease E/G [Bacteroidota bacterium]